MVYALFFILLGTVLALTPTSYFLLGVFPSLLSSFPAFSPLLSQSRSLSSNIFTNFMFILGCSWELFYRSASGIFIDYLLHCALVPPFPCDFVIVRRAVFVTVANCFLHFSALLEEPASFSSYLENLFFNFYLGIWIPLSYVNMFYASVYHHVVFVIKHKRICTYVFHFGCWSMLEVYCVLLMNILYFSSRFWLV